MEDEYLTPESVCRSLPGMTPGLLAQMRYRGDGPKFIKPSPRKVLYRKSDLEAWLKRQERTSTSEVVAS